MTNKPTDVFKWIDMTGGSDSCWPWTGATNSKGRPFFNLHGKKVLAYRLVYKLVTGTDPGEQMIRHQCDNPVCCNPKHHLLGNNKENMHDMKTRERHGMPHHTVRMIKKLLAMGVQHKDIASRFGCSRQTVTDINNGVNYSHVTLDDVGDEE